MDINHNNKDDIQEIKDGFAQIVTDAKNLDAKALITDLQNGAAWTVNYVADLCEEAQTIFNAVITKVRAESATLGEAVANALTLLNNPSLHNAFGAAQSTVAQLLGIGSDVITKVLSLLSALPAAVGA